MRKSLAFAVLLPLAVAPVAANPAQAQSVVKQKKLERNIERGFAKQGYTVTAKCPKNVTWVKGKTFYCRITSGGDLGRIRVTLKSNAAVGNLVWKLV